jgi:hypothetical protein
MPRPASAGPTPASVRLRMYRVGFGDCFLLTFQYAAPLEDGRSVRHVLIDFGSTSLPKGQASLLPIAKLLNQHTNGEIDVVVVSHRHRDHLSAFGSPDIAKLLAKPRYPKLVVRSWTEDPTAAPSFQAGTAIVGGARSAAVADRSMAFLRTIDQAERFSQVLTDRTGGAPSRSLAAGIGRMAFGQLKNKPAVDQLRKWAGRGSSYLHYGLPSGIEAVVPGISVRVLGPPTVDQHPAVATQRSRDPDEFWMLYRGLAQGLSPTDFGVDAPDDEPFTRADDSGADAASGSPDQAALEAPRTNGDIGEAGPVRWLTKRMGRQQLNSLLRIVRILDDVLNNTSVILLFELPALPGGAPRRLLFPGDAQIENWEYALKVVPERKDNLDLLRGVDLYQVGHHGSRNATPRTLFNLWDEPETQGRPMSAVLSTKAGVHGDSPATAVPRKTLVAALDTRMTLFSTQSLTSAQPFYELAADLSTTGGFVKIAGP